MNRICPECDANLTENHDMPVYGGVIDGSGYVHGTFPCPECGETLNYEAKLCSRVPF